MTRSRVVRRAALALAALGWFSALSAPPAVAWLTVGHRRVAADAVRLLPPEVPAFFRDQPEAIGAVAMDPDYWKIRAAPELGEAEGPHHYLDWERLADHPLPPQRSDYFRLLERLHLEPSQVGELPYVIEEGTERLMLCFAEARKWPGDAGIEAKCLVYAGWLGHYAADLEQPLHTTIHHDGWALPGGKSPKTGIHRRIDALFVTVPFDAAKVLRGVHPHAEDDLWQAILDELRTSHALVDETYRIDRRLTGPRGTSDPAVLAFTAARYRAAADFLANLYLTAWVRSAKVDVPSWMAP